jgi:hypothetical protein
MVHDFHFILDHRTKEQLFSNVIIRNTKISLSNLIKRIIRDLIPIIRAEHQYGNQRVSKYKNVAEYPDGVVEHVHVYFFEPVYRELKCLHNDLNFYSIAQLVRYILRVFLELVEEYGRSLWLTLRMKGRRWAQEKKAIEWSTPIKLRQLYWILSNEASINKSIGFIVTIYDRNFEPFWILRL